MKLKLDENGHVVVQNDMPVYILDNGDEQPFDAPATLFKVKSLTEEKDRHFKKASDALDELKGVKTKMSEFEGIDINKARKALETVEKLDGKEMIEAGEFDKLKQQMQEIQNTEIKKVQDTSDAKINELESILGTQKSTIDHLMINNHFSKSPYFAGDKPKTVLTPDLAANLFGNYFKVEGEGPDAKLIGYINGEKIPSRTNVGEPASFEEAITEIIEKHPGKERFLRSSDGGGPGAGSNFGARGGAVVISAADSKDPVKYRAARENAKKAGVPIQVIE
jgi:hypothetical protein